MGYYATFLEKMERQKIEAEEQLKKDANRKHYLKYKDKEYHKKNYEKQKQRSREYYWKNKEYVLERQRAKKYETSEYYKEWYKNNREQVNLIRYDRKVKIPKVKEIKVAPVKKVYTAEDFILFK